MAGHRRSSYKIIETFGIKPPSRQQVIRDILDCPNYNTQILVSLLYITAGRITEILNIRKKDIEKETDINGNEYLQIRLMNQKNKTFKYKTATCPVKYEKPLADLVLNHIKGLPSEGKVCPFNTRSWAFLQLRKHLPDYQFNHFLRALRITHLIIYYKYGEDPIALKDFAGWSDLRPLSHYQMYRSAKRNMELMN